MEGELSSVGDEIDIHSHLNELNTPRIQYIIYSNVLYIIILSGDVSRETLMLFNIFICNICR